METVLDYGIIIILWFQSLGSWLEYPMKIFSFLGSEEFYLLSLPVIYWSVNAGIGLRIGLIVLFSTSINDFFKLLLHGPRPYWYSTNVKAFASETSFGVPSGHAQISTTLWGMAAAQIKRQWAWVLASFIVLIIGLSRLYLAVHFPHDVLLGWVLGVLILWCFITMWDRVAAWAKSKSTAMQVGLAFTASMLLLLPGIMAYITSNGWVMPAEWLTNASRAGGEAPNPFSLDTTITSAAVIFGMLAGLIWMNSKGGFATDGTTNQRILRLLPGLLGILVLYLGLKMFFPSGESFIAYVFRYIRYAMVGLWISFGAPWLFIKIKLASTTK